MGHSALGGFYPDGEDHPIGTIYYNDEIGVVVVFRGSREESTWLTDFDPELTEADAYFPRDVFPSSRGQVHIGFAKVIRDCRRGLKSALTRLLRAHPEARNKSFYAAGHSLGGALSKFGALSLIRIGDELEDVDPIHFGDNQLKIVSLESPRIGSKSFYEFFEETIPGRNILEFRCQGDIVPRVPAGIATPPDYGLETLPPGHFISIYIPELIIEKYKEDWEESGFWGRSVLLARPILDLVTAPYYLIKPGDLVATLHSVAPRLTEVAYLDYKEKHRWGKHKTLLEEWGVFSWNRGIIPLA